MSLLSLLAREHYTTDKESPDGHSYVGHFYEEEFAPLRERPIDLLEIGVQTGGSLRLWADYFTHARRLVGVDLTLASADPTLLTRGGALRLVEADAYDPAVAAALGEFNVIIDDGPHTLESQVAAIRLYAPRLRPGGRLVVEDVQSPDWLDPLRAAVPSGLRVEIHDLRHVRPRWDDLLFVVRNPHPGEP